MAGWDHGGGFSVDAAVRIKGNDRAGLERLLRYDRRKSPFRDCARPPFALEYLQQRDAGHLDEGATVEKILEHIGESTQPPRIAPARGPPLWEAAAGAEPAGDDPLWDASSQPGPEFEFDQRIAW